MGPWRKMLVHVACSGLLISGFPGVIPSLAAQEVAVSANKDSAANSKLPVMARVEEPSALNELPDSPGAIASKSEQSNQQQNGSGASASPPAQSQSAAQSQPPAQKPVGTAAAEAPDASGVAASQPAGVAIAPAKQRRTRTIILRMGAIIGVGVAVGSVVALTSATSSKPPGAH
jgi:hypothetical protein